MGGDHGWLAGDQRGSCSIVGMAFGWSMGRKIFPRASTAKSYRTLRGGTRAHLSSFTSEAAVFRSISQKKTSGDDADPSDIACDQRDRIHRIGVHVSLGFMSWKETRLGTGRAAGWRVAKGQTADRCGQSTSPIVTRV